MVEIGKNDHIFFAFYVIYIKNLLNENTDTFIMTALSVLMLTVTPETKHCHLLVLSSSSFYTMSGVVMNIYMQEISIPVLFYSNKCALMQQNFYSGLKTEK